MIRCNHCDRIIDRSEIKIRETEYTDVKGRYIRYNKVTEGVCPECESRLKKIDLKFGVAILIIDIIIAIISYILYILGIFDVDCEIAVFVTMILMAVVSFFTYDNIRYFYIKIDSKRMRNL